MDLGDRVPAARGGRAAAALDLVRGEKVSARARRARFLATSRSTRSEDCCRASARASAQHLLHEILQRLGVLHQHRLGERIEGGIDCGGGRRRHDRALGSGDGGAPRGGSTPARRRLGCGASSNTTSGCPSIVWKLGAASPAAAIARSGPGHRPRSGCRRRPAARRAPASIASMSCCSIAAAGGCGGAARRPDGAAAWPRDAARRGRRRLRRRGGRLAVSSSAMMRRMEARISSIEGSCAFAGWLIANPYSPIPHPARRRGIRRPPRITRPLDIYSDRPKYVTANRTPTQPCGYAHIPRSART